MRCILKILIGIFVLVVGTAFVLMITHLAIPLGATPSDGFSIVGVILIVSYISYLIGDLILD